MEYPMQVSTAPSAEAHEMKAQQHVDERLQRDDTRTKTNKEGQTARKHDAAPSLRSSAVLVEASYAAGTFPTASLTEMDADRLIPVVAGTAPQFAVLHPQGFRILNNASAMERNMRGYFRLPQPPNAVMREEYRRLQRTFRQVQREEAQRKARITGSQDGVVLDGFLILSACEADDPEMVTTVTLQASQLTSSVQEDLPFFTQLKTLDVSDNQLSLGDVLPFPHLETVHLVCNSVVSLADVVGSNSSSLSTLAALNLAYNRIPSQHLLYLGAFSALQSLDLSNNGLRSLPADLSSLAQLTHLALESNQLASASVFHSLGTLPALLTVNLANNRLSCVPVLRTTPLLGAGAADNGGSADIVAFPSIQTMTLSGNRFADLDTFLPLAALHRTLRHIAVGDNPFLLRQPQEAARQLQRALDEAVTDWYFITKDPAAPLTATDTAAVLADANAGTWQGKMWVQYIAPRPQHPEEHQYDEKAQSCASSNETAAPMPIAGVEKMTRQQDAHDTKDTTPAGDGGPLKESQSVMREGDIDDVCFLSVEDYLERYHIVVQCAPPPPPPPKQPTRYFYSTAYRVSRHGEQNARPLVTLPPYEEFMDIYRIAGRQNHASRRKNHPMMSQHRRKMNASTPTSSRQPTLPVIVHSSSTPPPSASAVASSGVIHMSNCDAGYEEEDEEEHDDGSSLDETQDDKDGFFLTGLNSNEGRKDRNGRRSKKSRMRSSEKNAPPVKLPAEKKPGGITEDGPEEFTGRGTNVLPESQNALPQPPLPRSVVSPANTNVHAAISELRAMLRKPLPSLPYEPARSRQIH